jgi:hypothetical protein
MSLIGFAMFLAAPETRKTVDVGIAITVFSIANVSDVVNGCIQTPSWTDR